MQKESSLGFRAETKSDTKALDEEHASNQQLAMKELNKLMRPELINRFDAIVTFRALTNREITKIFNLLADELNERLIHQGIHLVITPSARRHVISKGYDEKFGARPLRRALATELEQPIADGILSGEYQKAMTRSLAPARSGEHWRQNSNSRLLTGYYRVSTKRVWC